MAYITPDPALMRAAITRFGITAANRGGTEYRMDWLLDQQIAGEPV